MTAEVKDWQRLDPVRGVINLATNKATELGHGVIHSYHLLWALVETDRGFLVALGKEDKISPLLQSLQRMFPSGLSNTPAAELSLTDGVKDVVSVMVEESILMGRPQIEKGHLWAAIIRQSPIVSAALKDAGITLDDVRAQYLKELYSTDELS